MAIKFVSGRGLRGLLRMMGLFEMSDDPLRPSVVHVVPSRLHRKRLECWPSEDRGSRLVLVGKNLPRGAKEAVFADVIARSAGRRVSQWPARIPLSDRASVGCREGKCDQGLGQGRALQLDGKVVVSVNELSCSNVGWPPEVTVTLPQSRGAIDAQRSQAASGRGGGGCGRRAPRERSHMDEGAGRHCGR
jgi:hypothetical protein